jgi:type II secretory pathway pseudopilin PulG
MKSLSKQKAFTVVEVLIAVSVAGLILFIVFLAVPAMNRNERNTQRKKAAALVFTEVGEYYQNNHKYPDTPQEFCQFIGQSALRDPDTPCSPTLDSGADCVLAQGKKFSICYHERTADHTYMGPFDQINIQQAHWCGTLGDTGQYPITDTSSGDSIIYKYVVWTPMENGGVTCLTNN